MPVNASTQQINALLDDLLQLREACLAKEGEFEASIAEACPQSRPSAQNLVHYLALRQHDLRDLQSRLTAIGVSSLGGNEASALAGVDAVIGVLRSLAGKKGGSTATRGDCVDFKSGSDILRRQSKQLLGPVPKGRGVRVMVTMPSEAAQSYDLVRGIVEAGMDVMRVNCAHDSETEWELMIGHMRRANQDLGRHCKVVMDLAGPKLRTGSIHRGHHVVRWRVVKDARGLVTTPARIALVSKHAESAASAGGDAMLPVTGTLLSSVRPGDTFCIKDSRNKKRQLKVIEKDDHVCWCSCEQGAYILSGAELRLLRNGKRIDEGHVGQLPFVEEPLRLQTGDLLVLTKEANKPVAAHRDKPQVACTLPEVFTAAQAGQPIFFDDGKIEGRILEVHPDHLLTEIVHAGAAGAKLGSAKGINLPETDLGVGAMTEKDRRDLDFVAKHSDIVGLSFVRRPEDVDELQRELKARGKGGLGIILKIESRQGFEQLPMIMLAALRHHPAGIMVARGDLAVEIGFERLAEVQEEILWMSEAAHMPVIWATQVLETLAKTGMPSRAEVTDAAMGVRAECVMLNKGEHIIDAVHFLDRVLHRMQAHHQKKRSMLRRLAVAEISHAVAGAS